MPQPCIVFDLDDTLYLERDYVRSGFNAVGHWATTALGLSNCAERAWHAFESGVRGSIFQVVLTEAGRAPEAGVINEMVRVYRNHSPVISMPEDSLYCLQELRKYAALAVITDGIAGTQQAKCHALSLHDLVDTVICTGQWGPEYYKPNPYAFNYLAAQPGRSASRFAYIADNPTKDFQAPIDLGWDVVRIKRPAGLYSNRQWPTDRLPYVELPDLWTLPDVLMNRFPADVQSRSVPRDDR
jgi:putative hydrolase of the HAD superfamily